MASVKDKTVSGVKWQVANKVAQKFISVATFAVLARMLEPSTFGLFAMAFIAIDGFALFKSFGIDSALVRKKNASETAINTAFLSVQATGFLMFAVCYLIAPFASHFFNRPEVGSVIRALGVVFVVSCFGKIPTALLIREMRFRVTSVIELTGAIVNSVCAIAVAFFSPTVWSLVWAYVMRQAVMNGLSFYFSKYKFKFQFDPAVAKELFGFGKFLVGISILWYLSSNFGNAVIAKILGATALGYYALAINVANFANTHFTHLISNVMFPAYSSIQDDQESLKRAYLKTIKFVSIFTIPFSFGLVFLAKEFVLALYGERWLPIVPLIRIMGLSQFMMPVIACSGSMFTACGKPQYDYYLSLSDLLLKIPLLILFTKTWGLVGTACVGLITSTVFAFLYFTLLRRVIIFKFSEFFSQLIPSICCAFIMLVCIGTAKLIFHPGLLPSFLPAQNALLLLIFGFVALVSYGIAFFFIDRPSSLEVRRMLFKFEGA